MSPRPFHHVALFRLREGVTLDRVRSARDELQSLIETLPGVLHFAASENLAKDAQGFRLVLFSVFEDRPAFEIFRRHPEWQRVHDELLAPVVSDRIEAEGG